METSFAPAPDFTTSLRISKYIRYNRLFTGLSDRQFKVIEPHLRRSEFAADELITLEGAKGDSIYLIESGVVEVIRKGVSINRLAAGESFGMMSYFNDSTRSASVQSLGKTTVWILDFETLSTLFSPPENQGIFKLILGNHINSQQRLVQEMDDRVVVELEDKLKEAKAKTDFGHLFVTIVMILVSYIFMLDLLARQNVRSGMYLNSGLIVVLGIVGMVYIRKSSVPREVFGLSLKNWKSAVKEAVIGSLGLISLGILVKWGLVSLFPHLQEDPFLSLNMFHAFGWGKAFMIIGIYAIFIPFQEIIIRCAVQGSLQYFFSGRLAIAKAILTTSLMFSVLHLIADPVFAYFSLIPSIFWGILYARNPSLLGVSISHFIVGIFAIWFEFLPLKDLVQV